MKVGIIGTGSWATALAQVLADNGQEVICKGKDIAEIEDIQLRHRNEKFFPGVDLSLGIQATDSYEPLKDSDVLILAVPVIACETVAMEVSKILVKRPIVINVAKGFHPQTKERLSVHLKKCFNDKAKAIVSLLGPSHAEEVVRRLLTLVNAVSEDEESARMVQELFANDYFRVYRHTDVIGAEIAAAAKNVMAIASGILAGLKQGDNARAALMTRGLAEMTRFGIALGAQKETFLGLNGVGDLIVTCSSQHSRNFRAGLSIGLENSAQTFLQNNSMTTEGVLTTKTIYLIAKELQISMPITEAMYHVLYEDMKPSEMIRSLMARPLKAEEI